MLPKRWRRFLAHNMLATSFSGMERSIRQSCNSGFVVPFTTYFVRNFAWALLTGRAPCSKILNMELCELQAFVL